MKIPSAPPATSLESLEFDRIKTVLSTGPELISPEQDGRYLHWDELRHRPSPKGLDHDSWWHAVRWARLQSSRRIALADERGNHFTFSMTDTVQRLVHEIDRDASGRIELPEDVTNRATRDRYVVNSLIEEAITSSQLEGASTTRAVAKEMLRTKREPRSKDEQMILNNFHAMEWVRDHVREELTADLVLELQTIVTEKTLTEHDGAGRFRRPDENVTVVDLTDNEVLHVPPPSKTLASRMAAMCKFANATSSKEPFTHPVVRSILLHLWLAYDHPFVDGNGRTARALFYWSMLRQGYWLTEFLSISRVIKKARSQYERAFLFTETDGNDSTYFLLHQLKVLRTAIDDLFAYLRNKAEEVRAVEKQLHVRDDLNNRQLALLGHALRHPDARYTIEAHQNSHRVVYQTARTDLLTLAERGYLQQLRVGRKLVFAPVPDLDRRLGGRTK
jgi:Fic family protein